jgi:F-type H+-transporting ATPase subunit epsilon
MAQIHLEVVTPAGPLVSEAVDSVTAPGLYGEFGVLAHHAPFLTAIKIGTLSYKRNKEIKYLMVSNGFAEVSKNKVTFLVENAEFGHEIDVERALKAKERAQALLAQGKDPNRLRAEAALHRAIARITAAERSKI